MPPEALGTPENRFDGLRGFPIAPRYREVDETGSFLADDWLSG